MAKSATPNAQPSRSRPTLSVWQKVAIGLGGAGVVVIALTQFLGDLPPLIHNARVAYVAFTGLWEPGPGTGTGGLSGPAAPKAAPASTGHEAPRVASPSIEIRAASPTIATGHDPAENDELGPPPRPGCHIVVSTDSAKYPAVIVRSWSCEEAKP